MSQEIHAYSLTLEIFHRAFSRFCLHVVQFLIDTDMHILIMYRVCTLSLIPVIVADYKDTKAAYCLVYWYGATLLLVQSIIDSSCLTM